jgi:hypothetical protein
MELNIIGESLGPGFHIDLVRLVRFIWLGGCLDREEAEVLPQRAENDHYIYEGVLQQAGDTPSGAASSTFTFAPIGEDRAKVRNLPVRLPGMAGRYRRQTLSPVCSKRAGVSGLGTPGRILVASSTKASRSRSTRGQVHSQFAGGEAESG